MAGKVMETVIQISGVMSDSVKQAVGKVNAQLGLIDKKSMATATKRAESRPMPSEAPSLVLM